SGWVLAPFRMENLMAGILGERRTDLSLRIYDSMEPSEATLLYDSGDVRPPSAAPDSRHVRHLTLCGRPWTILLSPQAAFAARTHNHRGGLIAGAGLCASLLLFLLVLVLTTSRARAERLVQQRTEQLQESETNFRTFFETVDDLIVVGTTAGQILYANPAVSRILGYSAEELAAMRVLDLHPADKRQEAEAIFRDMLAGARTVCPLPLAARNGTCIPVETRIWIGRWNGEPCIFGISKNLSRQEAALQMFERIFRHNPNPMALSSLPTRQLVDVNDAFLQKTGFTRTEVIGRTSADLNLFVNPEALGLAMAELEQNGCIGPRELKIRTKEGAERDGLFTSELIDSQGQRTLLTVMVDLTEQKRAEAAVRASEEQLRLLLDSTAEAIYGIDLHGDCTFCNPACLRLLGYERPEQLIGRNMHWQIHGRHADGTSFPVETCRIFQAFVEGKGSHVEDEVFWRADGTSFPVEYWSYPQRRNGVIVGAVITFLDVTATRAIQAAALRSQQDIGRLSALRRLLAQLSAALVHTGSSGADAAVRHALTEIGAFSRADRSYVFLFNEAHTTMHNTHEWCAEGIRPEIENLQEIPLSLFPMWMRQLEQQQNIHIPSVARLPDTWYAERDLLTNQNIQSLLVVPMVFGGRLIGFVGFDAVRQPHVWSEEEIDTLRLLGDLLAGLLGRTRLEVSLRHQTDLLEGLLASMPEIVFFKDREGVYLGCNPEFERFLGRARKDIVGRTDADLFAPDIAAFFRQQDLLMMDQGSPRHNEEWVVYPDGARILIDTLKAPLRNAQGVIIGLLGASRDITERRRLEDELRLSHTNLAAAVQELEQARDAAEAANRAKSTFVANMSHEIRTPLNAILGYTQILQRTCSSTDCSEQRASLAVINKSGEHLLSMINDVLSVSRMDAADRGVRPGIFNIQTLLRELAHMFEARPGARAIRFQTEWLPDVPQEIKADSSKIRQVLMNLLGNAVRFTREGSITLRMMRVPDAAHATTGPAAAEATGEHVLAIEVEDTGPGMASGEIDGLFQPFAQGESGRRSGSGTGLGLAISRDLARLMGGDITARSQPGKGSNFRFSFLAGIVPPGTGRAEDAPRRVLRLSPSEPPRAILVVDDDANNRIMLGAMLRLVGYQVREAASGYAALALLQTWRPDAVLMDLRMPDMDGVETMRRAHALCAPQALPVLIVTAEGLPNERDALLTGGAAGYISKPLRESELLEELRRVLHVAYEYSRDAGPADTHAAADTHAVVQLLASRSAEERQLLRQAVRRGDIAMLRRVLAACAAGAPAIAAHLQQLTARYDYEEVIRLLETAEQTRSA
ncbi:MAG: PAS domain S-box protein, partial [bacterium]